MRAEMSDARGFAGLRQVLPYPGVADRLTAELPHTEKTGIPASRVLHEAWERYIEVVMPARLRTLEKEGLLK
jgi:hypothetical protein